MSPDRLRPRPRRSGPADDAPGVSTGPEVPTTGGIHPRRRRGLLLAVAAAVVVAGVAGVTVRSRDDDPSPRAALGPSTAVDERVVQERYGVRVDLVGLTALGGLVQLRFTVLDADKAAALFHSDVDVPTLLVEKTGAVLRPPKSMAHKLTLLNGASYFVLYANASNVVRSGADVSLVIDDVRLEHLAVQS